METKIETNANRTPVAWQPLTARGVAAFARSSLRRTLAAQFLTALLAGSVVIWFLATGWFPVIREALTNLPASGEIRYGQLDWKDASPKMLAEGHFVAFTVDLGHEGQIRSPAHVQIEFGRADVRAVSLLGYLQWNYPKSYILAFGQDDLKPWWGAWAPMLLAVAAIATVGGLLLVWSMLATLYSLPAWLACFFLNRDLGWRGSWRLAGASMIPGALFMLAAIVLYGFGAMDLIRLMVACAIHFVIPWAYIAAGCWRLPCLPEIAQVPSNPFLDSTPGTPGEPFPPTPPAPPAVPPPAADTTHDDGISTRTE